MTKVVDFSIKNKSSDNIPISEVSQETSIESKCSRECPQFISCSAPLCPMDAESLNGSIWYCDEEICTAPGFGQLLWIRNQKKISKKCRDTSGYFNLEMLSHNCQIKGGITGLDPDKTDIDDKQAVKLWLKKHPVKREVSEKEREIRRNRMISVLHSSTPIKKDAQSLEIEDKVCSYKGEEDLTDKSDT